MFAMLTLGEQDGKHPVFLFYGYGACNLSRASVVAEPPLTDCIWDILLASPYRTIFVKLGVPICACHCNIPNRPVFFLGVSPPNYEPPELSSVAQVRFLVKGICDFTPLKVLILLHSLLDIVIKV